MKSNADNIYNILSQNSTSFYIPPFQRGYAWGEEEIERYFQDIKNVIDSENDPEQRDKLEHFLGIVVINQEKEGFGTRSVIIDGQQRLTSTLLLIIAIRDLEVDQLKKTFIEDTFLRNNASTLEDKIKLKQVTSDWDAYRSLINGTEMLSGKITDAYNAFLTRVRAEDYIAEDYIQALHKINLAAIFLDERPHKGEDPQIIFETLNSLGRPLTFGDLIRNYIMLGMPSKHQAQIYDDIWFPKIEEVLKERTSHFFRDVMQLKMSQYLKVINDNNTKNLYGQFKLFVDQYYYGDKEDFISQVTRLVGLYHLIDTGIVLQEVGKSEKSKEKILELIRNIFRDIGAEAFKPFILGVLDFHQNGIHGVFLPDEQLIAVLEVVCTYLIRRRVINLTQMENRFIPGLCMEIEARAAHFVLDGRGEMLKLLSSGIYRGRMPNDLEIEQTLKRIDFYNGLKRYSKFILGKIEEHISKVAVPFRDSKITIEHIMPQKIDKSASWKEALGGEWHDVHRSYIHNIGNLILSDYNGEMGNKDFVAKKEILTQSNLGYRNDVLVYQSWGEEAILFHQRKMIIRFLETFPLPLEMQKEENWGSNDSGDESEDI